MPVKATLFNILQVTFSIIFFLQPIFILYTLVHSFWRIFERHPAQMFFLFYRFSKFNFL